MNNLLLEEKTRVIIFAVITMVAASILAQTANAKSYPTLHKTIEIDGVNVFYREAGPVEGKKILLLHGFPTSSHMFRNLIPRLSDKYHVIAPDYPGFGNSDQPSMSEFEYSFDSYSRVVEELLKRKQIKKYSVYLMDYGAPVGYRLAERNPKQVESLIIQNGNAYDEGLKEFWDPIKKYWKNPSAENAKPLTGFITREGVKWQFTHGVRNPQVISPDNWNMDLSHLSRKGNPEIQLRLFYDYRTNVPLYPKWQRYFREYQPPALIVWGKNDYIFPADGAYPYKRDLKNLEFHLLDTGHFALEEDGETIAGHIRDFLKRKLQ